MKTPPKLLLLRKYNRLLRKEAWANYLRLLRILLRTNSVPNSDVCLSLLDEGDFEGLVQFADSLVSAEYETPHEHRVANQFAAVVRKYPFDPKICDFGARKAAFRTFMLSERKCSLVNRRFKLFDTLRIPHESALNKASSWIGYVLGECKLSDIHQLCDFGPGASLGIHGNATNQGRKLLSPDWSVTPGSFYLARASMKCDPHIRELLVRKPGDVHFTFDNESFNDKFSERARLVQHNKICFVPKTARTERTIAVEPLLNGYLQKGIDVFMRKRLKRVGIDLEDQSRNQELARQGSCPSSDPYATIDLSSASDSISIGLCKRILPPDWYYLLDSTRSHSYEIDGVIRPYHKFVTMGNGFCFPLETLIFASLCHVAYAEIGLPYDFSVYGDDIIVRSSVANRVLELLRVCGFKANTSKTFLRGPFRESCGADWYEGKDVRPFNLDYELDSVESIFKFLNLTGRRSWVSTFFLEARDFVSSLLPPSLTFVRPYLGNADSAIEVPLDVFMSSQFCRWNSNLQCWSWVEIMHTAVEDFPLKLRPHFDVVLMRGALKGAKSSSPFAERRKVRTKVRRISFSGTSSLWLPRLSEV